MKLDGLQTLSDNWSARHPPRLARDSATGPGTTVDLATPGTATAPRHMVLSMPNKPLLINLAVAVAIAAGTFGITWHVARSDVREDTIQPVAALLDQNSKLVESLKTAEAIDSEGAILPTYLSLIRKDGVAKHSDVKQQIDQLVNNNTAIVALLTRYTEHEGNASFRVASHEYTDYATTLRDRWQSLFEIFMAGGNLATGGLQAPGGLAKALASS